MYDFDTKTGEIKLSCCGINPQEAIGKMREKFNKNLSVIPKSEQPETHEERMKMFRDFVGLNFVSVTIQQERI